MSDSKPLYLNIDLDNVQTYEEYKEVWDRIPEVEVKMIERKGGCFHEIGDTFTYRNHTDRPEELCASVHHVFNLYLWRVALGFPCCPPWGPDDRGIYHIHCPAPNGTVWELKRKTQDSQQNESTTSSEGAAPEKP